MKDRSRYPILNKIYLILLLVLVFSGFGQMPIYKRYYIADIPGLGWSADFYNSLIVHYVSAVLLLVFFGFIAVDYFLIRRKEITLTKTAYVRIVLLAFLSITGIFGVINNLRGITFSKAFTHFIDISHLGFTLLFLVVALVFLILKKGWTKSQKRPWDDFSTDHSVENAMSAMRI